MARAFLVGLLVFATSLLFGLLTLATFETLNSGSISPQTLTLLVADLACLLVLFGIAAARSQPAFARLHCSNCGSRIYETRRSLDRARLMTCFACGMEWAVPASVPIERTPLLPDPKPGLAD